jgi:hypothetical protein
MASLRVTRPKDSQASIKPIKNNLDLVPERWQDNKLHPREMIKFLDNQGVVFVTYKDTGSIALLDIFAEGTTIVVRKITNLGSPVQLIENPSPILCKQSGAQGVVTFHDSGVLQIYNIVDGTMQRIKDPAVLKLMEMRQKPQAIAFDAERIRLVSY